MPAESSTTRRAAAPLGRGLHQGARRRAARFLVAARCATPKDALASEGVAGTLGAATTACSSRLADPRARRAAGAGLRRAVGVASPSAAGREPRRSGRARREAASAKRCAGERFAVRARTVGRPRRAALPRARRRGRARRAAARERAAASTSTHPEVTARIEVHQRRAPTSSPRRSPAPGGLPLGTEGRALALVSGGFDSAVAAWQLQRRGVAPRLRVLQPRRRARTALGALRVMKLLAERWSYGYRPRLHAVDFAAVSRDLQASTEPRYWQVILKRLMLRAAEAVARADARAGAGDRRGGGPGLVADARATCATISEATRLPILRPLVGIDKDEIVALAHRIGTGAALGGGGRVLRAAAEPARHAARLGAVLRRGGEARPRRCSRARVAAREVHRPPRLGSRRRRRLAELAVERVPDGAVVIDLRTREEFAGWHWPGALQPRLRAGARAYPAFAQGARYVVYCEYGLKSAHLAELMRKQASTRTTSAAARGRSAEGTEANRLTDCAPAGGGDPNRAREGSSLAPLFASVPVRASRSRSRGGAERRAAGGGTRDALAEAGPNTASSCGAAPISGPRAALRARGRARPR